MKKISAIDTPTLFVESQGRRLAYRSLGTGVPLVLCTRFRGNLDAWDPAFLDALAACGFRVVAFDYSGLGRSTGTPDYNPVALAQDACDLIEALGLTRVVIGGWSLGGLAAQVVLASFAERVSHGVLIGTSPPGPLVKLAEQIFYDTATKPENDLADEAILFFEPRSPASVAAARASHERIAQRISSDRSAPVPWAWAADFVGHEPKAVPFPADAVLMALRHTTIPILHIGGDHDVVFPVENWYALNQQLPTLQLLTYPASGHGPQHQHPLATARHIATFVGL